ncbi:protein TolA [Bradyrhizobium sp.]|uniref:protein TolA n=1 Tax=Bradyrhizobium sp. TaxID=376 RepID=UPI002B6FCF36|nr:protein TolA [Bradyrhizobium sp.]HWX61988.1 protein TolA [Bradyrhizobium sp.]
MAIRVDKTLIGSIALHVLVIGWGLISFSARSYEVPQESMPVDIISSDQLAKITAGLKNGDKDKPKPMVDKVADAKPIDEAIGKVTVKEPIVTDSTPKPVDKPVEKKPDPPKPVTETKPKDEPKQAEKKPDPPKDPIAEALKNEEAKKPKPKQEAKAAPPPQQYKPKERVFDPNAIQKQIAMNQDKRDPTHQTVTGTVLNASASLGTHAGTADVNSASWASAFMTAVRHCFSPPYNGPDQDQFEVDIDIQMRLDGTVAADPVIVDVRGPSRSIATAVAESAKRAILQCQAYAFLPKDRYQEWKTIPLRFGLRDML